VLQFFTEDGSKITVRPSGTEPKIKFYFGIKADLKNVSDFEKTEAECKERIEKIIVDLAL
jgi:phosphoglucomutase